MPALRKVPAALALTTLTASAPGHPGSRELLAELNRIRADPARYADELIAYREGFDGLVYRAASHEAGMMSREGVTAVDEAIAALRQQAPLPPLDHGDVLSAGASSLVDDQAESGAVGHVGRDSSTPGDRVRAHGGDIYVAETIAYGEQGPRDIVRQLLVDDGVAGRGHRVTLLSRQYRFAGAWCGPHPRYRTMCVIDLARTADGRP